MTHYIIIKNPEAARTKYFGAKGWTYDRKEAVRLEGLVDANRVIKNLICQTACAVSA